jgi:hypothetical protein
MNKDLYKQFKNEDCSWNREKLSKHLRTLLGFSCDTYIYQFTNDADSGKNPYDWINNKKPINPDPLVHLNSFFPIATDSYYLAKVGMK